MARIRKRKTQSGNIRWEAEIRMKGFEPQLARFNTMAEAKHWSQKTETDMRAGRYRLLSVADQHTVGEMIDRYLLKVLPTKSDRKAFLKQQKQQLLWWKERLGSFSLSNVSQSVLTDARDHLALTKKPSTVNRYLAALSHVFSIAVREWEWMEASPMTKLRRPSEGRGRNRFLTDAEREALLHECRKVWRKPLELVVVLAISTGARKNELLGVRWQDVDFARGIITLQQTKNNQQRALFVADLAADLLRIYHDKRRRPGCDLVFSDRAGKAPMMIDREFRAAIERAGLDDFKFHDLRHSSASYLAMNGATGPEIAEVLGHKSLKMVSRYAHHSKTHTASVVASMNNKIFGALAPAQPTA